MTKSKLMGSLKRTLAALDAAYDEQQRASNGQFGSGGGSSKSSKEVNSQKVQTALKDISSGVVATGQETGKKFSDLPKQKLQWMAENLASKGAYRGDPVNVATAKAAKKALSEMK